MSNFLHPAHQGQVIPLAKSPQYWRRRAEQHRKRGEHHRAAALLRHAVALDPASGDLRMEYARSLRDMSCFEASTREAFGVLALDPTGFAPYQIIGRNMLSLGREQEAIDAFSHYLERACALPGVSLFYADDDEFYELEDLLDVRPGRGRARLDALCHIGSLRMARGDLLGAGDALARAERLYPLDGRLHALSAMLFEAMEQLERALTHALISVAKNPRNVAALCALASVRFHLGEPGRTAAALLKAAFLCHFPHDEQLFCFTASAFHMPELSLAMLRLSKHKHPDRLPTLFNYAVVLLELGRLEDALAYLHRCLDLDPADLAVQSLFHAARDWQAEGLSLPELQKKARELSFYPFLPLEAVERLLTELGDMAELGMDAFAGRLLEDGEFYRAFLYALSLPSAPLSRLIFPVASALARLEPAAAERLLRHILVQNAPNDLAKRYALSTLMEMGADPPYVIWQDGRILQVAPPKDAPGPPSAFQRHLLRRIRLAARRAGDSRFIPHALTLAYHMTRRMRYALAADRAHVWTLALLRHFALAHGTQSPTSPWGSTQSSALDKRVDRAFVELCVLMPLP